MIQFDNHAFKGVDDALKKLADVQYHMGDSILALLALFKTGLELSNPQAVIDAKAIDKTINADERLVESTVASIIGKFTVAGEELRYTLGCIKTAGALERSADRLKNAVKWMMRAHHPLDGATKQHLADAVTALNAMVPLALTQLTDFSTEAAQELIVRANQVQNAYRALLMQHQTMEGETPLLLVAKNLEQTSDTLVEVMKICHFVHVGTKYEKSAS